MIDVRTCNADLEKEEVLENKQREARYLSISEASCHGHQVTRIEWNFRTIFLLVFLIIVFLIIMFNIYIYLIFPQERIQMKRSKQEPSNLRISHFPKRTKGSQTRLGLQCQTLVYIKPLPFASLESLKFRSFVFSLQTSFWV